MGPVVAGGALAVFLANTLGGVAVAGLAGALLQLGLSESEARYYESQLKSGRTLLTVKTVRRADEAVHLLRQHNGYDLAAEPHAQHNTRAKARPNARPA